MDNLQIGSFVLNSDLLVYLVAGAIAALLITFRNKEADYKEQFSSVAWNTLLLWIIVWKGSYIVFDLKSFAANWQSILYFDGGTAGFVLAAVIGSIYLLLSFFKHSNWKIAIENMLLYVSSWLVIFSLSRIVWGQVVTLTHYVLLILSLVLALLLMRPAFQLTKKAVPQLFGVLLVAGLIGYIAYEQVELKLRVPTAVSGAENVGVRVGQTAPNFTTVDLTGKEVQLAEYRGKTVLLNFWATWCSVCKAEMPHVQKLHEQLDEEKYVILSVNSTSQDSGMKQVEKYIYDSELTFQVVLDESGQIIKDYRVRAYPVTLIIAPDGTVTRNHTGAISYDQMKKAMEDAAEK
ncbi:TlpA family protein disulfide reductase [Paenibacillus yanchengensis]|uniref:TlpA family protein disulfide reductase n=1 Tax=Paenibacillus yanchengensis TaxID=2035833 RepID=A0ABW4YPG3_9BACL